MTADEALPWLFLVLAAGTFLVGAFLLVSGRQAKAAGEESNKIKFFNIEIESSTSGTTLIILSILATVLIISLGIAPAADDDNDGTTNVSGVDDPTTPTDPTTTPTDPTDPPDDNPSGLEADRHLLSAGDVADASQGYGFTGWQTVDSQDRPVLDCLERVTKNLPGFVLKAVKRNFQGQTSLGYDADAMTSAARYESPGAAQANFQTVSGWLQSCPGGVSGSTSLDPNQAGSVQTGSSFAWRNFWTSPSSAPCAGSCIWVDSQGVGLVDDRLVLFSVRWYQEDPFTGTEGPIPDLLPEAMEEAEE